MSRLEPNANREAPLREQVERLRVTYEVRGAEQIVAGQRRTLGFDLTLCGAHPAEREHVVAGSGRSRELYGRLADIAHAALPAEDGVAHVEIRPFDRSLHIPKGHDRREVELVMEIRHRDGRREPPDERERHYLEQIERGLEALGVRRGAWG